MTAYNASSKALPVASHLRASNHTPAPISTTESTDIQQQAVQIIDFSN